MAKHNKIGSKGEQIAADFLLKKGYKILHLNWRCGKKEVDIVAVDRGVVVIVEVKTRTSSFLAFPEEAVNEKKRSNLRFAAGRFLEWNPVYRDVRFDIVSLLFAGEELKDVTHFEEAFH